MMSSLSFLVLCSFSCVWSVWLEVYEFYDLLKESGSFCFTDFFIYFLGRDQTIFLRGFEGRSKSWEDSDI